MVRRTDERLNFVDEFVDWKYKKYRAFVRYFYFCRVI
jgi:hypothetical protein